VLPFCCKDLDVFKDGSLDLGVRSVANTMCVLVLETVEPILRRRVIPAVSSPACRTNHAIRFELVLKGVAGVRATPVGMMHQPRCWALPESGHGQISGLD
jgi:hypothetical protein